MQCGWQATKTRFYDTQTGVLVGDFQAVALQYNHAERKRQNF